MMCVVYVVVLTVGLAVQILAATDCSQNGAVRFDPDNDPSMGPEAGYVQLCVSNQWNGICGRAFSQAAANVVCRELEYNGNGATTGHTTQPLPSGVDSYRSITAESCTGQESTLSECNISVTGVCNNNEYQWVKCRPADCTNGSLRLVGGASYREGRVEVCVDGRWGTVCYNEQLAGTVCSQPGFSNQEETSNKTNIPVPKVNCTNNDMKLSCGSITQQELCEGLMVMCQNSTNISSTGSDSTTRNSPTSGNTEQGNNSSVTAALGALVGLLVLLEIATVIGFILYVAKTKGQRVTTGTNESYSDTPSEQPNYSTDGPHYNVLERNVPPKITLYQPDHPPPVGGVSEDQFYNAENHMYAAINKGAKKGERGGAN